MREAPEIAAHLQRALHDRAALCVLLPRYDYVQLATVQPLPMHPMTIYGVPIVLADGLMRTFMVRVDHTGNPILEQIP